MAKCHICGQSTESGSVCLHCRAALNRLRERAAPHGDGHGMLALAGATVGGGASAAAPAMASSFLHRRKDAVPASAAVARAPTVASGARSAPWLAIVGMGLLVVVGGIAVYQLVDSGSAPVSVGAVSRPPDSPPAPPVRVLETPAPLPAPVPLTAAPEPVLPTIAPAMPAVPAKRTIDRAPSDTESARASEPARAVRPAAPIQPPSKADAPATAVAAAPVVTGTPPALPAATPAKGRWDRMDAALEECSRREFLNRLICREKVRMEYCEGQWGKTDRCPGTPAIEHGG